MQSAKWQEITHLLWYHFGSLQYRRLFGMKHFAMATQPSLKPQVSVLLYKLRWTGDCTEEFSSYHAPLSKYSKSLITPIDYQDVLQIQTATEGGTRNREKIIIVFNAFLQMYLFVVSVQSILEVENSKDMSRCISTK